MISVIYVPLGTPDHRDAFFKFPFRWIYYCHGSKSTGKKTVKTHLCADAPASKIASVNPIPTGHGRNQPIYERHMTKSGRNRIKVVNVL